MGAAVVVECVVGDERERVVVDDANAAVLGLELVHRAVELVGVCAPAGPSADGILLDGERLAASELSELAVQLAAQSVTLVGSEQAAAWRLCVSDDRAAAVLIPIAARCESVTEALAWESAEAPAVAIERFREGGS